MAVPPAGPPVPPAPAGRPFGAVEPAPRPGPFSGARGRIAVVAAALALALVAWAVTGISDTDGTGRADPAAEARPNRSGAAKSPEASAEPKVPVTIAHLTEEGGNSVAITIDDGPDPRYTPPMLDILKARGVKAVFCMVGPAAKAHPQIVKRIVAEGHRLCDHSMSHDTGMDKKPVDYQRSQILDAQKLIEEAAGGTKVLYYRAPGGAFTPDSRRIAAIAGMRPLGWNVDSKDFTKPGTAKIVSTVKGEIGNGPTILFHDGGGDRTQTVAALAQILDWLKETGRPTGLPIVTAPEPAP
ncbi:polysaccharide deacetylase family protein [Streptomyces sp. BI20]|uniref:polysaccharide deacetylase family protein n=1 Tax=Streptomyces sp. BI20 TaxID=3403460 RepID=UPI003C74C659